jgi:hypothetical protein
MKPKKTGCFVKGKDFLLRFFQGGSSYIHYYP